MSEHQVNGQEWSAAVCDLSTGVCGPGSSIVQRVSVTFVTDPICSACWAMEPAWRAIEFHYGDLLDVRHVYGGLLPSWEGFADAANGIRGYADVAGHWEEIAALSGQALNVGVWHDDPIASSFPPSLVAAAVRDIDPAVEGRFLRRLREELFIHGRNIARPEVWSRAVRATGLDVGAVQARLSDGRAQELFRGDLDAARSLRATAFPTLILESPDARTTLRGVQSFARLESVVTEIAGTRPGRKRATMEEAIEFLGVGTSMEYATVLGRPVLSVDRELSDLGLQARSLPGGTAWLR